MNWIIIGCLAFILLTLFDANKIYRWHGAFNALFPLSMGLLSVSSVFIYLQRNLWGSFTAWPIFYGLVALGLALQIHALFFALPAAKTYASLETVSLVKTGVYGLCRHPGVWGFILMSMGLTLATGSVLVLWTALVWTVLDLVHIWIQDVFFFPQSIPGYVDYQQQVPFLFFGVKELKRCRAS